MRRSVAVAVVRDDPPEVFVAEDQDTLNWVLALKLIARTPGDEFRLNLSSSALGPGEFEVAVVIPRGEVDNALGTRMAMWVTRDGWARRTRCGG